VPDRRTAIRFEILGRLRGTVTAHRRVSLHNLSGGGALIEASWPLERDALIVVKLESSGELATLEARVCHVRPTFTGTSYLVGLQFTSARSADEIERLVPLSTAHDVQPS
jgi:hypothetical protein